VQVEVARLYQEAKVNPLAGCLPTLITLPVWIGLYRALSNVADEGLLTEGFFWIPSLAGPTSLAAQKAVRFLSPVGIVPCIVYAGLGTLSRTHSPCCSELGRRNL
jgi:membrane protein insertase Oxa1/YidC/SpoIIIJ